MSTYTATTRWRAKPGEDYRKGQYSRAQFFVIASEAKQSSPFLDCRVAAARLLAMTNAQ
jgi:hypothetical protein